MHLRPLRNALLKRAFYLFLACVLSLAGVMQLRASATSLLSEEKVPVQRLYEEIEHHRVLNLRMVEQRQGLRPHEHRLKPAAPPRVQPASRQALHRRPSAPRAPPHFPRAPPFIA